MGTTDDLINPSGKPLIKEPKLCVLKIPQNTTNPQMVQQLTAAISKNMGVSVVVLPMDAEILMGKVADNHMVSIHSAIHAILEFLDVRLTMGEIKILYSAMQYVCKQTQPGDGSPEVKLTKQLKEVIDHESK